MVDPFGNDVRCDAVLPIAGQWSGPPVVAHPHLEVIHNPYAGLFVTMFILFLRRGRWHGNAGVRCR